MSGSSGSGSRKIGYGSVMTFIPFNRFDFLLLSMLSNKESIRTSDNSNSDKDTYLMTFDNMSNLILEIKNE